MQTALCSFTRSYVPSCSFTNFENLIRVIDDSLSNESEVFADKLSDYSSSDHELSDSDSNYSEDLPMRKCHRAYFPGSD